MFSIRLPDDLEKKLERVSKEEKKPKSRIVKEALASYLEQHSRKPTAYELGKDLFGKYDLGIKNLARDHKKIYAEMLREDHIQEEKKLKKFLREKRSH